MKSRNPVQMPPLSKVRDLFNYDAETGILTARIERKRNPVGAAVGTVNNWGRLICRVDYKIYYVHRLIWLHHYGTEPPAIIDHANGDKTDNRIANLRAATTEQNMANICVRKTTVSGLKGAHWSSQERRWRSSIRRNGKPAHLGWFDTKEEAAAAYEAASRSEHGAFSVYNRS